jgi:hypothetical protein
MNTNEKPVLAATRTRAKDFQRTYDNYSPDYFQCPRSSLTGNSDVFSDLDWPDRLLEAIARHPRLGIGNDLTCMIYQEARYLFNWIIRNGYSYGNK